ncbi:hypothetical protein ACFL3H_10035, partial [Gemmatimonadota bacterium]
NPALLVSWVVQTTTPDSFGSEGYAQMRFDLTTEAKDAIENGAIMELALRVPEDGAFELTSWTADNSTLVTLEAEPAGSGSGSTDYWWRSSWADPSLGQQLVTADGRIRIRVTPVPDPDQVVVRVIEVSSRLDISISPGPTLATSGNSLLLQSYTENRLIRRDVQGVELGRIGSAGAPRSICHSGSWYFGVSTTELQFLSSTGGSWERLATLPWGEASTYALTTDGTDLYLIRRPLQNSSETYQVLYRMSDETLRNTHRFAEALLDSTILERNGLLGGVMPGFAYWSEERLLVTPGRQEGNFGLVTFSRAGRFRKFIPLPFSEGGVGYAFVGDYLFVTSGNPELDALMWTGPYTPALPSDLLLYRWPIP